MEPENKPGKCSAKAVPATVALKLINRFFEESPKLHHFYKCREGCKIPSTDNRFKLKWLFNKDVAYCQKTGLWWLLYEEGNGMFCLLCRIHDCENPFNHQKKFNQVPAARYKKSALAGKDGHSSSQQHEMAIEREHTGNERASYFHKEFETQQQTKDSVLYNAFLSAYWLARKEIANCKFTSLLELVAEIRCFQHRAH